MSETRLFQPLSEGEHRIDVIRERAIPKDYKHVLYVVHPSTIDGDHDRIAQSSIQTTLNSIPVDRRIILIAPPQRSVYLEPNTEVTDIRSDIDHHRWVSDDDIPLGVRTITLIGGNLERCLGTVYQEARASLFHNTEKAKAAAARIDVVLPLDAIYTLSGTTAQADLQYLLQIADPLDAITALLTTSLSYQDGYGNVEIISSNGAGSYEIELNGNPVGQLKPSKKPHEPLPEGWTTPPKRLQISDITVCLKLIGNTNEGFMVNSELARSFQEKIKHAKEVALPKYQTRT